QRRRRRRPGQRRRGRRRSRRRRRRRPRQGRLRLRPRPRAGARRGAGDLRTGAPRRASLQTTVVTANLPRVATTAADNAIELRGLVKRYGSVTAVDGLDLAMKRGECFGLLGPHGAGKTTTIEILEGPNA